MTEINKPTPSHGVQGLHPNILMRVLLRDFQAFKARSPKTNHIADYVSDLTASLELSEAERGKLTALIADNRVTFDFPKTTGLEEPSNNFKSIERILKAATIGPLGLYEIPVLEPSPPTTENFVRLDRMLATFIRDRGPFCIVVFRRNIAGAELEAFELTRAVCKDMDGKLYDQSEWDEAFVKMLNSRARVRTALKFRARAMIYRPDDGQPDVILFDKRKLYGGKKETALDREESCVLQLA